MSWHLCLSDLRPHPPPLTRWSPQQRALVAQAHGLQLGKSRRCLHAAVPGRQSRWAQLGGG